MRQPTHISIDGQSHYCKCALLQGAPFVAQRIQGARAGATVGSSRGPHALPALGIPVLHDNIIVELSKPSRTSLHINIEIAPSPW